VLVVLSDAPTSFLLAHGIPGEGELVGVVRETIEDGVGQPLGSSIDRGEPSPRLPSAPLDGPYGSGAEFVRDSQLLGI